MKTHRKQRVALASIALAGLFGTASCNVLLGIDGDEYRDVAVELCGCPGVEDRFPDCQRRVRDALDASSPEAREGWLGTFDANQCGSCRDERSVDQCLLTAPLCKAPGGTCLNELDCCGAIDRDGTVYCHEGRCMAEAPECRNFGESCATAPDCCGSEAGTETALCADLGCFESCLPGGVNCPGCCAKFGGPAVFVLPSDRGCIDGPATAEAFQFLVPPGSTLCDIVCVLGENENCPEGLTCKNFRFSTVGDVQLCLGPNCAATGQCPEGLTCFPIPISAPGDGPNDEPADYEVLCIPDR